MNVDKSLEKNIHKLLTCYQNKQFKIAEDLAQDMAVNFPDNNFSWKILSSIFMEDGDINKAKDAIVKAVKIDPSDYKALSNMGTILFKLGSYDEAISAFHNVLELNKENIGAYINLGVVYQKKNDLDNAEYNYMKAIKINPNSSIAHNNLGNTLKDLNRLDEAELSYNKSLEIDPSYVKAKDNLNLLIQEKEILNILNTNKYKKKNLSKLLKNPFTKIRKVEPELISSLYKIKTKEFHKTEGGPLFGNGSTTNYKLFSNNFDILTIVKNDLIKIMKESVNADIYLAESFLNILNKDSGSFPHNHIMPFDKNNGLVNQKFSLVYYINVGDQKASKPGKFILENPKEEILPKEGTIIIIPANRTHSAVYNGKTDRIMIGINFYSLK